MVPPEVAEERVRAAVAAGGTLVSDAEAPSFWVLADAYGNQVCICTGLDREGRGLTGCRDGRPIFWDACHTGMTDARPGGYRGAMHHDILVRTRRVS